MKGIKYIVFMIIVSISLVGCGKEGKYEKAKSLMSAEKYDEAILLFDEISGYKDSDYLKTLSYHSRDVKNDKEPPVIEMASESVYITQYDKFNIEEWCSKNVISVTDNITNNIRYEIIGKIDSNDCDNDQSFHVVAKDEAGNEAKITIPVIIYKWVSPVEVAYKEAVNISYYDLKVDSIGIHSYKGINIPESVLKMSNELFSDKLNQGTLFRSLSMSLIGYRFNGWYRTWGEDVVKRVFGIKKPKNKEKLRKRMDLIYKITNPDDVPIGEIIYQISKLSCVSGKFDFLNSKAEFEINDLNKACKEIGVTEEFFGYILAQIEEYGAESKFDGNTYSCKIVLFPRNKSIDSSDMKFFYNNKYTNLSQDLRIGTYWVHTDVYDGYKDIEDFRTNKGLTYFCDKKSVQFSYGKGTELYGKNLTDIIAYAKSMFKSKKIVDKIKSAIYYSKGEYGIAFIFNKEDKLIAVIYEIS